MGLKTGDIDLQGQTGLETSTVFEKMELFFYTFKLELYTEHLLVPSRRWLRGGGSRHLFL